MSKKNHIIEILSCKAGTLLVHANVSNFIEAYALKCGQRLLSFTPATQLSKLLYQQNLLANTDFNEQLQHWISVDTPAGAEIGVDCATDWHLEAGHTGFACFNNQIDNLKIRYRENIFPHGIPVIAQQAYIAYGYFAAHRCEGALRIICLDKHGAELSVYEAAIVTGHLGGKKIEEYQQLKLCFTTCANTAFIQYEIRNTQQTLQAHNPEMGSYLFFTRCGLIATDNKSFPEWQPRPNFVAPLLATASLDENPIYSVQIDADAAAEKMQLEIIAVSEPNVDAIATLEYHNLAAATGSITALEGQQLKITVLNYVGEVCLLLDKKFISVTNLIESVAQFVIPPTYFDNEIHTVEIRDQQGLKIIARDVRIFPSRSTPWEALQTHSSAPLPYQLAPAAQFRYQALKQQLDAINLTNDLQAQLAHLAILPHLHEVLSRGFENLGTILPLTFPYVQQPKISVIIPVHNKFNVTYYCLCALLFAPNRTTYEVILVDDGSSDETINISNLVQNITYCRHELAEGFIRACNFGAQHAQGEYLVFLNNDTEPTCGWLDELVDAFTRFENVGLVGSKLLYPDGRLQEAGGIVWNTGNPWNYGHLQNPWESKYCYTRETDYVSGAAMMLPKAVWETVAGFSTEFAPAYFEDTDLAFKIRAEGLKVLCVPSSIVYHFEGISNGTDVNSPTSLKRYQEINRPKFKRKWAQTLLHNGEQGKNPDLAKDRGIIGRVLFIDYQTPTPDIDAGSYAAISEMRLVQSLGYKVTFMPTNLSYMGRYTDELQRMGIETIFAPFHHLCAEFIQAHGAEFQVIYLTRYYVAKDLIKPIRQYAPKAKILFNNADLHFLRELRVAMQTKAPEAMQHALATREEELAVMREVDVVLSYNKVEHAVIQSHNLEKSTVVTCPWVVDTLEFEQIPKFSERQNIAFLGGYGHPPNQEAVEYFIHEIMPLLRQVLPEICFNVYGSKVPASLKALACKDVNIIGFVETVDIVYAQNRVFIAPLLTGAGIKGKVLGALAHGIPCVLSPVASEGTGVKDGFDCLIAQTPEEWTNAIVQAYTEAETWESLSKNALAFTKKQYSFASGKLLMQDAFEAAGIFNSL